MPDFSEIKKSLLNLSAFSEEQVKHFTERLIQKELKKESICSHMAKYQAVLRLSVRVVSDFIRKRKPVN